MRIAALSLSLLTGTAPALQAPQVAPAPEQLQDPAAADAPSNRK